MPPKFQTHCRRGHLMAGENLMILHSKDRFVRKCRACHDDTIHERRQRYYKTYRANNPEMFNEGHSPRTQCRKGHLFVEGDFSVRIIRGHSRLFCLVCKRETERRTSEKTRNNDLLKTYGISTEEYEAMLLGQDGVCAICRKPDRTGKRLSVDHDHARNAVRGLLCSRCNRGIGNFDDDPHRLKNAARYLRGGSRDEPRE